MFGPQQIKIILTAAFGRAAQFPCVPFVRKSDEETSNEQRIK
jgi:hypothetical protein